MKIGLFFGSFNPLHIGHNIIANYMADYSDLDKVMFVISPQNPFKNKKSLLDQHHRLQIIKSQILGHNKLDVSDIEFSMSQPSYTIDTLVRLKELYPKNEYAIIMGADNLKNFHKWKNFEDILEHYSLYIYPRSGFDIEGTHKNINIIDGVPKMEISASFIRDSIKRGDDISYLIPEKAWNYIDEMNFYK